MRKFKVYILILIICFSCKNPEETVIDGKIFEKLSAESTGIDFENLLTETHDLNYFTYSYLYMGGGVAAGDVNNDGLIDLFFIGNQVSNKLFLNKGDLTFEDITEKAGVKGDKRWYTGVTMADVNSDGHLDIYCSVSGKFSPHTNQLFMNNGDGTFIEKAVALGVDDNGATIQSTFFDYDNDGDLDLYVGNYPPAKFNSPNLYYLHKMKNHSYNEVDHLYRNDGDKGFTDVSKEAGIANYGLTLGTTVGDLNNDGWPDLYISNDFSTPDYLYLNQKDGTFKDVLGESTAHTAFYGMGIDIADFNNDGNLDIFQPDMDSNINRRQKANMVSMNPELFWSTVQSGFHYQYMQNCLQLNSGVYQEGKPYFTDVSRMTGVSSTDWTWGGLFADFDNDGLKDLFVSNGTRREVSNHDYFDNLKGKREDFLRLSLNIPSERIDNFMFKNKGDLSFKKMNDEWGIKFKGFSNGAIYADLDNDGDLEVITNNLDDKASIFKNKSSSINNFLTLNFKGKKGNLNGLGTRVFLKAGNVNQFQELTLSRGFQSSVAPQMHFGIGKENSIKELEVVWPDGKRQILTNVNANQFLTLDYSKASQQKSKLRQKGNTLFAKINDSIFDPFVHDENYYDDFQDQVLLPHRMSKFGPALAVGDLNDDNIDDYFIGGAMGQAGALFFSNDGIYKKQQTAVLENDKNYEDVGAVIFDADGDGDNDLYVVSGGYEFPESSELYGDRIYINKGKGNFIKADKNALPAVNNSGSRVYAEDFDQDGKKDLLVLGRQVPKKYPLPATTYLWKNVGSKDAPRFESYSKNTDNLFKDLGMATSASTSDYDGDGYNDIIIVGEWMPIRIFKNGNTGFKEVSQEVGLTNESTGWWWSITASDFDNDGDLDYLLGNNGLNYKYKANGEETFDIHYKDFDGNGQGDIVLSYYNQGNKYPVRGRSCSSQQIPTIKKKFKDYQSFSEATLTKVYGEEDLEDALHYQVKSFASIYLENDNGKFIVHELPREAQVSSINQIIARDFDGDGNQDILIAGNLYVSEVETPRNDAGIGQFLKGDGKGNFNTMKSSESGFFVPGDVKDMRILNSGKKEYLIVVNNSDQTEFFEINN